MLVCVLDVKYCDLNEHDGSSKGSAPRPRSRAALPADATVQLASGQSEALASTPGNSTSGETKRRPDLR